jgi:hypothetical protein
MHTDQAILLIGVCVLALALIFVVVGPRLRMKTRGRYPRPIGAGGESSVFSAVDRPSARPPVQPPGIESPAERSSVIPSTATVPALTSTAAPPAGRMTASRAPIRPPPTPAVTLCPTCRRQYAAGLRFCPFDARVLTPHADPTIPQDVDTNASRGKICPTCARRYDSAALVCGRDGAALVSVN